MNYRLPKVVDRILHEETPKAVIDLVRKALREVGVEHFCLIRFPRPDEPFEVSILGMSMPTAWVENYKFHKSQDVDPGIQHSREVVQPFFWYDAPAEEPRQIELVKRAREMGIPDALVVPVPGPRGSIGTMWMGGGSRSELHTNRLVIQAIGLAGFYRLQELSNPVEHHQLTKREQEILALVAEGKSAADIGSVLHLSARTIEWHITRAMQKLEAKNRIQAVVLAIRDGLIAIQV
jgi:DNA-binding CsgD family transcriptional regulator